MAPGIVLVILWLFIAAMVLAVVIALSYRWLRRWLSEPDEPSLPPPEAVGAESVVLHYAEQFVDTVQKSEIPEWKRHRYTEVTEGKLVPTQQLAEAVLVVALVDLWHQGFLNFRIVPKAPDPFDTQSLDREVLVVMGKMLPMTPLGRIFAVGFRDATKPIWLLREARKEAPLEDMIEFALREIRRQLGWRKAKRNSSENLIVYVREVSQTQTVSSDEVAEVKSAITALQEQDASLAEAVKTTVAYTLTALRRLEPDRDEMPF